MAVTQYIGARYVPIFADEEWSIETVYEPLTVVMHNGNSYTSRQSVPTGIDIEDSDYWVETGNYNAQVEAYRHEVLNYSDRIDAASDKAGSALEQCNALEPKIKANTDSIRAEAERAAAVEKKIADAVDTEVTRAKAAESMNTAAISSLSENTLLKNQHIVLIGDSYMEGKESMSNYGLAQGLIDFLGLKNAHNYGNGGAGFGTPGTDGPWPGQTYLGLLQNTIAVELSDVADQVTKVVFQGCWNDGTYYKSGLYKNVANTVNAARAIFPNAEIYVCTMLCGSVENSFVKNRYLAEGDYRNGAIRSGAHYSVCRLLPMIIDASTDGIHPTKTIVTNFLVPWLASFIQSGFVDDYLGYTYTDSAYPRIRVTSTAIPIKLEFNTPETMPYTILNASNSRGGTAFRNLVYFNVKTREFLYATLGADGSMVIDNTYGLAEVGSSNLIYLMAPTEVPIFIYR